MTRWARLLFPEAHFHLGDCCPKATVTRHVAAGELRLTIQQDPEYPVADSYLGQAIRALIERKTLAGGYLERCAGWPPARGSRLLALPNNEGDGMTVSLYEKFDAVARANGKRLVIVVADGEGFASTVPGPAAAVMLDAAADDLFNRLETEGAFDEQAVAQTWLSHAREAARKGVERRRAGELAAAYVLTRFALFVAVRLRDGAGVAALSGNIWTISDGIRNVLVRALGPENDPDATTEERAAIERYAADLAWAQEGLAHDAAALLDEVVALCDDTADRRLLLAAHRLGRTAGVQTARSSALARLLAACARAGDDEIPLIAACEDLSEADLLSVLNAAGILEEQAGLPDDATAWTRYVAHRHAVQTVADLTYLAGCLASTFRQFAFLRLEATTAGGAFGHQLSYAISALLQPVGRDLATLLLRLGHDHEALGVAEAVLARSMVDWMSRTHATWRPPPEMRAAIARFEGSINAVDVLDAFEISAATSVADAAILVFLQHAAGLHAWLVVEGREVLSAELGNVAALVAPVAARLPYLPAAAGGVRDARPQTLPPADQDSLDRDLQTLYDALVPPLFDAAIAATGKRLAIVADPALNTIPFACLRTPREHYLIEERDLVSWPSVTAWVTLESGARVPTWLRARRDGPVEPLVMGKTDFAPGFRVGGQRVRLDPLPGAGEEARVVARTLGTEPLVDDAATLRTLVEQGSGAEIIHLATHGILDAHDPMASSLVLTDGPLTARDLYMLDHGIHAGLVVLSACQTGLGGGHPDSAIGLESAFLIAGAQTVVSTLWRIDDQVTAALMAAFYEHLAESGDVAAAMRRAQRLILEDPATGHPVFWAAFQVTGIHGRPSQQ